MPSAGPRVVAVVISDVEVEAESLAVEAHRAVQVGDRQHDCHEAINVRHVHRLPAVALAVEHCPRT